MSSISFHPSSENIDPDAILQGAVTHELAEVLVLGWYKDGDFFIGSSQGSAAECLLLAQTAVHMIMKEMIDNG